MSEATWYYARAGQRMGPVSRHEIDALVRSGAVTREDLVWTAGMAQWAPAGTTQIFAPIAPAVPVAQSVSPIQGSRAPVSVAPLDQPIQKQAQSVGYYNPTAGMPPRAIQALLGYAKPTGDLIDWPLDDAHIAQFESAYKLRKTVSAAATLYRALLVLTIVCSVIMILGFGGAMFVGSRGGGGFATAGMGVLSAVMIGFCLLYFFAHRATVRAKRWAPLTMFIIYMIGVAFSGLSLTIGASQARGPDMAGAIIGNGVGLLFGLAFAVTSWKSYAAIPRYLAQPAWCQELLVRAKL
jgi:hypothetical protein